MVVVSIQDIIKREKKTCDPLRSLGLIMLGWPLFTECLCPEEISL